MRHAEHEVSVEWKEPGSWVSYEVDGDTEGTWTGPRIRLAAIDAWWARGVGPPSAEKMPELVGETVTLHVDGTRQVYVLREWHPGPEFPGKPSDGHFDAEWPDLRGAGPAGRLVPDRAFSAQQAGLRVEGRHVAYVADDKRAGTAQKRTAPRSMTLWLPWKAQCPGARERPGAYVFGLRPRYGQTRCQVKAAGAFASSASRARR